MVVPPACRCSVFTLLLPQVSRGGDPRSVGALQTVAVGYLLLGIAFFKMSRGNAVGIFFSFSYSGIGVLTMAFTIFWPSVARTCDWMYLYFLYGCLPFLVAYNILAVFWLKATGRGVSFAQILELWNRPMLTLGTDGGISMSPALPVNPGREFSTWRLLPGWSPAPNLPSLFNEGIHGGLAVPGNGTSVVTVGTQGRRLRYDPYFNTLYDSSEREKRWLFTPNGWIVVKPLSNSDDNPELINGYEYKAVLVEGAGEGRLATVLGMAGVINTAFLVATVVFDVVSGSLLTVVWVNLGTEVAAIACAMWFMYHIEGSPVGLGLDPATAVTYAPDSSCLMPLVVVLETASAIGSLAVTGMAGGIVPTVIGVLLAFCVSLGALLSTRFQATWLVVMLSAYLSELAVEGWLFWVLFKDDGFTKSFGTAFILLGVGVSSFVETAQLTFLLVNIIWASYSMSLIERDGNLDGFRRCRPARTGLSANWGIRLGLGRGMLRSRPGTMSTEWTKGLVVSHGTGMDAQILKDPNWMENNSSRATGSDVFLHADSWGLGDGWICLEVGQRGPLPRTCTVGPSPPLSPGRWFLEVKVYGRDVYPILSLADRAACEDDVSEMRKEE